MKANLTPDSFIIKIFSGALLLGILANFLISKGEGVLFVNGLNTPFLDLIFTFYTYLGSALIFAVLLILSLFVNFRFTLMTISTFLIQGLLVQIGKRLLFRHLYRPIAYFTDPDALHLIEGVNMHHTKTFPSGHTATAFAAAILIALILKKKWVSWVALMAAIFVAFSRLYLAQHFFIDVVFGALIGTLSGMAGWYLIRRFQNPWMEKTLFKI